MIGQIRDLACDILNNRFTELSMDPNASFAGAYFYYGETVKLKDAFIAIVMPKEGRETDAYKDLIFQLEKMRRYGFTNAELERVKSEKLNSMEKLYNERNTRKNITLARECIRHFEDGETMPGIAWEYEFIKNYLPLINLEAVNQIAKSFIHPNPTVAISGPEKEGVLIPSEETVLAVLAGQEELAIEAPKEEVIDTELVQKAPRAGKIKTVTRDDELGITEWMLNNGIKVVFKPTEFKADEILMQAFSKGGLSQVKTEDLPSAELATTILKMSGLGRFTMPQLEKALAGKTVSVQPEISENVERIYGSSSVKDLETMLQLTYLQFTAPRRDEEAFQTTMNILRSQLANRDKNPKIVFSDSVQMMSTNHSDRTVIFKTETLDLVTLDKAFNVFKARFANPADFTFIFVGNINPNDPKVQELVCQWLGGLKTKKGKYEQIIDHHITVSLGNQKNYFSRPMETTTASNRIQYTSYEMPYTMANDLNMEIIGRILSTRYLESIREREGGSYGVGTYGYMMALPTPRAGLIMQFDTDPQKQQRLMEIIHEEVQTIIENGPLASDLQKEKESMLKDFQEDLEKNTFWRQTLYIYYLYGMNEVRDYKATVESITAETVQTTLKKLVSAGNVFEVVMFPE
jgi:zinc protease